MIATRMQLVLTLKAATIVHAMKVLMTVVTHSNQEETAKVMKKVECPTFALATIAPAVNPNVERKPNPNPNLNPYPPLN